MSGKSGANINHNWLRSFLQYFIPYNQRIKAPKYERTRDYVSSGIRPSKGRTPGAFGGPRHLR
jgi:hypothetical protein